MTCRAVVAQEVAKRTMVWASSAGAMTSACTLRLKAASRAFSITTNCWLVGEAPIMR